MAEHVDTSDTAMRTRFLARTHIPSAAEGGRQGDRGDAAVPPAAGGIAEVRVSTVQTTAGTVGNTVPSTCIGRGIRIGDSSIGALPHGTGADASTTAPASGEDTGTAHGVNDIGRGAGAVRIVAAGIDNLYASVAAMLAPDRVEELMTARHRAQEADDCEPVEIAGRTFLLSPRSHRGYAIRLSSPSMDIWAHCEGKVERPALLIELRSLGIHTAGIEAMVEEAHAVASWLCPSLAAEGPGEGMKVSRIDLYCDVQGWQPTIADDDRWMGRARLVVAYDAELHEHPRSRRRKGRTFSGFTFGRGAVCARVYNKTLQMASSGHDWMWAVWKDADREATVWRVEVQLRRGVLRNFRTSHDGDSLSSVRDALVHRQAVWSYAVGDGDRVPGWLTLRIAKRSDGTRWRWPLDPVWEKVQGVEIGSPCSPLVRERHAQATRRRLLQGMTGYLTSLVAHQGSDVLRDTIRVIDAAMATGTDEDRERAVRMALEGMAPEVRGYCDERQVGFIAIVDDKQRRRLAVHVEDRP